MTRATLKCIVGAIAGETLEIDGELVVGRRSTPPGDLGGDPLLSRRQARFGFDRSGRLVVEDLGSTNGTWVNDERIEKPQTLRPGDEVRLGRTTLRVQEPAALEDDTAPHRPGTGERAPAPPDGMLRLRATAGPAEGAEISVEDALDIGRSFEGPGGLGGDRKLSRRHARIARGPEGRFFIEDTGSSNGTYVNDRQVRAAQLLADADEVRVGSTTLAVSAPAPSAGSAEDEPPTVLPPPGSTYVPQGAAASRLATGRLVTVFFAVFAAAVGISVIAVVAAAPSGPRKCPRARSCAPPPKSPALRLQTPYRSPMGWSAEYDPQTWHVSASDPSRLTLTDSRNDALSITAAPASQTNPAGAIDNQASQLSQHVIGLAVDTRPEDQLFGVPAVGFHDGVGRVYGGTIDSPQGPGSQVTFEMVAAGDSTITLLVTAATPAGRAQRHNPGFEAADAVLETVRFPSDAGA